eukprot:TRINITY_DN745_c0_g1_i5.p1 TRINITY_DN745_c0_g1~~TRINITY_DN745_c0_g1_i5.p1  ORF type:complete len:413 (-),score=71.62 TRINITY_DN745_c0_g1_i5:229-1467(-)
MLPVPLDSRFQEQLVSRLNLDLNSLACKLNLEILLDSNLACKPGLQAQSRNFAGQQPGLQGQSRNFAGQQPDLQGQSRLLPGSGQQAPPLPSGVTGGRLFSLPDVDQRTGPAVQDPPSAFQFPAFPGNPAGVGRSDDDEATRLLGILTSLTGDRSATAGDRSETARALPAGVRCVPFSECTTKKIYGTNPTHFSKFGVISPSRSNCLANSGKILCVTENTGTASVPVVPGHQTSGGHQPSVPAVPNPPVHTPTAPVPSVPGHTPSGPLPAATSPIRPQVSVPLPCVQASACLVVFGTNGDHFTRFGDQQSCPDTSQVRCVTAGGTVTTSRPITTKPPSGGGGVGPVAPSVSIIGPQPIYVSYNNVKGPSVGHDNSLETGGSVQSSGVTGSQQAQINSLLQVLKQRLRSILSG